MRRLLSLFAFLAGGVCAELAHPLQCDLAPASRGMQPVPERSRRRLPLDPTGDADGNPAENSSL
ncbi:MULTISPECIES: hypothetical protein [Pandoraea]|uniref:Uncharacterized protein n=1 Tax=Pandoraea iniqua TaxID=2508288 RepID=A0A5E4X4B8_9BURK|nr:MULTISPECIES: hypothetical protein [Pandoraea]VVE31144.1 hypothetical protein PIN31115_03636 [Pandoraea iniqua]